MGDYLGDYVDNSVVNFLWETRNSSGASVDRSVAGTVNVYKNGSAVQKLTANGITDTPTFDGATGVSLISIDTSNDTGDAGFWAVGNDYTVAVTGATIATQAVNAVVFSFSIENRKGVSLSINPTAPAVLPSQRTTSPITLEMWQHDAQTFVVPVNDAFGVAIDLSAKTMRFVVHDESDPSIEAFSVNAVTVSGASNNMANIPVSAAQSATTRDNHRWKLRDVNGVTLAHGLFVVRPSSLGT